MTLSFMHTRLKVRMHWQASPKSQTRRRPTARATARCKAPISLWPPARSASTLGPCRASTMRASTGSFSPARALNRIFCVTWDTAIRRRCARADPASPSRRRRRSCRGRPRRAGSMKILAFDSSLGAVSVAVRWRGGDGAWLLRQSHEDRERGHVERLMPMIAKVMGEAGLAFREIDRIAATIGPGSFTGVRVGVAAARGLALASGAPTVGASSLAVMAHQSEEELGAARRGRLLAVALDARRGSVYLQLFPRGYHAAGPPHLLTAHAAARHLGSEPAILVGSGAPLVGRALAACGGHAEAMLPDLLPSARSLALLASDLAPTHP